MGFLDSSLFLLLATWFLVSVLACLEFGSLLLHISPLLIPNFENFLELVKLELGFPSN